MMRKPVAAAACALLALAFHHDPLQAATPYGSARLGIAMLQDSKVTGLPDRPYDTGYFIGGAVGLNAGSYRVEAEMGYQENGVDGTTADLSLFTVLANGYLDFPLSGSSFEPFLGAGLGFATVDDDTGPGSNSDTVLAWQLGAGIGYRIAPNMLVDASWRYLGSLDADLYAGREYSIATHNLLLGIRFDF